MDFENLEYLKAGNKKQKEIYALLTRNEVMISLGKFDPILVGTFPINIDIETSDLDIICYWTDKKEFIDLLKNYFANIKNFSLKEYMISDNETVIARFKIDSYAIEIFGQPIRTKNQYAYRHMIIENEILKQQGEQFREQIIELKRKGMKTEPAFVQLLGLKGDPYQALLAYKPVADLLSK